MTGTTATRDRCPPVVRDCAKLSTVSFHAHSPQKAVYNLTYNPHLTDADMADSTRI